MGAGLAAAPAPRPKKVVVLGAGMVGGALAADLCREAQVTAVDANPDRLAALAAGHPLATRVADLRDPAAVAAAVAGADLAIGAVPGFMGFATLRAVIEAGINAVDISFFDEDPFELDALARARGVTAVTDAGVAPGLSNLVLGYEAARMAVDSFRCLVGGLPVRRGWPWQYKAPFSPVDVLEEYTRPARLMEHAALVVKPALSDPELVEIDPIGTLEAFNTDGLRTLLRTMSSVPYMAEKTLRYPGHIEYVRVLRESGFLGTEAVQAGGCLVRPIDLTAALLFPRWRLDPGEPEFTALEITIRGRADGRPCTAAYRLFDQTDAAGVSSMARTTGYTCTAIARLVLDGTFARAGVCPPEFVGAAAGCFERVTADLAARGVNLRIERC